MSPPVKLINLTTQEIWIEGEPGLMVLLRQRHRAHVAVHYQTPATGATFDCIDDVTRQPRKVKVRWPQWGSHRTRDDSGLDIGVEHLPAPAEGVAYIVSGMVAEQAALDGRTLDDLYVVLEVIKDDMSRTMASIIPAAKATPGMDEIRAARRRREAVEQAHKLLRQLGRLVGEPYAIGETTGYLLHTRTGAAYLREASGGFELVTAAGGNIEAGATLGALLDTSSGKLIDALASTPTLGPVRPGEVRRVVLGAWDPEMAAVADLCAQLMVPTVHHEDITVARDGDLFVECHPAGPGSGLGPTWPLNKNHRVVDHHHAGDAGFGLPPSAYLLASSIGQVAMALGGLHLLSQQDRVTAACDHCLGPAMLGRCPGVSSAEVEMWLAQHEPVANAWAPIDTHTLAIELTAAARAPTVQLSGDLAALDLRELSLTFAASYIGAFRRELRVFVTSSEVRHPPVGWPKGQPCTRVTMRGMLSESHFSAFRMWAEQQGAVDFFPDCDPKSGAAQNFAGFYV